MSWQRDGAPPSSLRGADPGASARADLDDRLRAGLSVGSLAGFFYFSRIFMHTSNVVAYVILYFCRQTMQPPLYDTSIAFEADVMPAWGNYFCASES